MASNGGTLNGVPQPPRGLTNSCNPCGVTFDSSDSFQVHLHYHHSENSLNRWAQVSNGNGPTNGGMPPTSTSSNASNSPTDSENNNQPKHHSIQKSTSPLNNTVSAAADSSDNQPATPQPTAGEHQRSIHGFSSGGSGQYPQLPQHQAPSAHEMHYQGYSIHGYDHYYQQHTMEYGLPPPSHLLNNPLPPLPQQEYKTVPSSNRFHPYGHHHSSLAPHHPSYGHHHQSVNPAVASSAAQNALSPRVVTSSSPIQNSLMHSTSVPSSVASAVNTPSNTNISQPTPTAQPQCEKCGLVCESTDQLNDHITTAHNAAEVPPINRGNNGDIENDIPSFQYNNYSSAVKEEAECDILDLDSQKMVYPPHEMPPQQGGPLPPMHSLHPMQRSMLWPPGAHHDGHGFLGMPPAPPAGHHAQDLKPPMYGAMKNEFSPPIGKPDFGSAHHQTQLNNSPQQPSAQSDVTKSFVSDVTGNQVASSPSEFPSTTTPQENGSQFRTFEPATSSLPNSAPVVKSSSWKSNEARRPKTYNCTACNKWFTSSGHLKRHYNTTLHKNAVKSSGQPDPATLPISVHHHPARDPSSKHSHRHNNNANSASQQHQQQGSLVPDPPRSPEYTPQYTTSALGFPQAHVGSFQQYPSLQTNAGIPPNGQAGPSVHASQPRGLLNYLNTINTGIHNNQQMSHMLQDHSEQTFMQQQQQQMSPPASTTIINISSMAEPLYNTTTPITINTNITQLYPVIPLQEAPQQSFHTIIGNGMNALGMENIDHSQQENNISTMIEYVNSDGTVLHEVTTLDNKSIKTEYMSDDSDPSHTHIKSEYYDDSYHHSSSPPHEKTSAPYNMHTTIPAIAALRRFTGDIYADTVPPFSPDIPDKKILTPYQLKSNQSRSVTPQTAEAVPSHLSPNGPGSDSQQYTEMMISAATQTHFREQGSPNVTSTDASIGQDVKPVAPKTKATTKRKSNATSGATVTTSSEIPPPGDDPLRCEQCNKVFNKACYLTQHNKTFHSGEKPYKCQRCGKRFPCDQSHDEHMAKHIGDKPFKCTLCIKEFNHKTDLRRHMCLHTGNKPYTCGICNKGFIRKDHMVKHGLTHLKRKSGDADGTADGTTNVHGKDGNGKRTNLKKKNKDIIKSA